MANVSAIANEGVLTYTNKQYDLLYDASSPEAESRSLQYALSQDNGVRMPQVLEDELPAIQETAKKVLKASNAKRQEIYDWKTKNKSFIKLHHHLRELGIKNNKFFLRIYQKELIGVDPYSPTLPLDMQLKVYLECLINPWYFLREVARMPEDGAPVCIGGGVSYKIDRTNCATWYLFLNNIDHYGSKPRQRGKTQDAMLKFNYIYHFAGVNSTMSLFCKDGQGSLDNLARIKVQRDMLPAYIQMRTAFIDEKIEKETDNVKTMRNPVNNNKIITLPKATSKEAAMNLGRGKTTAVMNFDEFDFTPHNIEIINASVFAYETARNNAIKNGSIACRIFTSTPGDLDTKMGEDATNFIYGFRDEAQNKFSPGMVIWKDEYYDMNINKFKEIVYSKNYNGIVFVEHTWKQLGLPQSWFEKQCQNARYDSTVIAREIELKRIRGNSLSPFTADELYFISNNEKTPIMEDDILGTLNPFLIYEKLNRKYVYIIAVDPSEALSGDNTAITVINPYTLKVAAEFRCNYIAPHEIYAMINTFMDKYCPRSVIVVENNRGRELLNYYYYGNLLNAKNGHWGRYRNRVYYNTGKLNNTPEIKLDNKGRRKAESLERQAWGVNTNGTSREIMIRILETLVKENKTNIISKYTIDDICGLISKNGKIQAGPGKHDDNIMSYLIGLYVYYYDKNIKRWGIDKGMNPEDLEEQKSDSAKLKSILEAISTLPEEMQHQFGDFKAGLRNMTASSSARREMDDARAKAQASWDKLTMGIDDEPEGDEESDEYFFRQQEKNYANFGAMSNADILALNFNSQGGPMGGSSGGFDLEDYL